MNLGIALSEYDLLAEETFDQNKQAVIYSSLSSISMISCLGLLVVPWYFSPALFIASSQVLNILNFGVSYYSWSKGKTNTQYKITSLILFSTSLFCLGMLFYLDDSEKNLFENIRLQNGPDFTGFGFFEREDLAKLETTN